MKKTPIVMKSSSGMSFETAKNVADDRHLANTDEIDSSVDRDGADTDFR
jgi:hypothetical protein